MSPKDDDWRPFHNPRIEASSIIEFISSRQENSSSVYVYDVAQQVGFGLLTKTWSKSKATAKIFDFQTRDGAGLSLVGRLSQSRGVLTAYITPTGLASMASSLAFLPVANPHTRLIVQVPQVSLVGKSFALSSSISSLALIWSLLPENVAVLISSTPQQGVDFATLSYKISDYHIIHLFDYFGFAREIGHPVAPLKCPFDGAPTLRDAFSLTDYRFFEYHGDKSAKTVIVLLNGLLAQILKESINQNSFGLGLVIVNVVRPWHEDAFKIVVALATQIHVLDEVPNSITTGYLFVEVMRSQGITASHRSISSHLLLPSDSQKFATVDGAFIAYIEEKLHISIAAGAVAWPGLQKVTTPTDITNNTDSGSNDLLMEGNAIAFNPDGELNMNRAYVSSWHEAAQHLLFPSAFMPLTEELSTLHPEILDRTYLVSCSVNKRLTPIEYDRNVFHLEFDTSGTGLKYAIGEALGVHGWNDEKEVIDFCIWYGVDPEKLITVAVGSDESKLHTRTILQALQQQIDLFGRPPKSFYTELSDFATAESDRYALQFIGSPEGSATFKKLSDKDTVTFADVLKKYPSARPAIERICEMIGDIKPRHYSIASAQSVVGDRVDLLVVTVDWVTPDGSRRHGQCTRYLAGLKVGQKVTVSVKPSVMKLPANLKQPLIMAGLGTGAAPFRAFLQHLAKIAQEGEKVGPVYYYFGSRHQSAEYLYGEEIEAFVMDGIISRLGLAFSRDSAKKIYIQHKMLDDSEGLARMLHDDKGVFYLCGPTWPVPDVYEVLVNALVKYKRFNPVEAGEYLENLKEEERYVLEVY